MNNGYQAYQIYQSLKLHFTSNYDAIKYNYKTPTKQTSFEKRRDRYFFEKLSRRFKRDELIQYFTSNLIENHGISELVDNYLAKNEKKIINIMNENNFTNEDCMVIVRTFLNKLKRLYNLAINYKENKNLDKTIAAAKPPIFWKDKQLVKQQIEKAGQHI